MMPDLDDEEDLPGATPKDPAAVPDAPDLYNQKNDDDPAPTKAAGEDTAASTEVPAKEPDPEPEAKPEPEPPTEPTSAVAAPPTLDDDDSVVEAAAPPPAPAPTAPVVLEATPVVVAVSDSPCPSPGASKFFSSVSESSEKLGELSSNDVSEGMLELSKRYQRTAKSEFGEFRSHALHLGIQACKPPEGTTASTALWKEVKGTVLLKMPGAALWGMISLFFLALFAMVYYPSIYLPKAKDATKAKLIEWKVKERALEYTATAREGCGKAYAAASSSAVATKGVEYATVAREKIGKAYETVSTHPVTIKGAELTAVPRAKASEAFEAMRVKAADKLSQIRDQVPEPSAQV